MSFIKTTVVLSILTFIVIATYGNLDGVQAAGSEFAAFILLAMQLCLGTGVFAVAVIGWWWIARTRHEAHRMRDGAWPIVFFWLVPWPVRLFNLLLGRSSPRARFDGNLAISPVAIIADTIYTPTPAAGWDRHIEYAKLQEGTNKIRAAIPGDNVLSLPWSSAGGGGVANAPTGRLLAGAYDRPLRPMPEQRQIEQIAAPPEIVEPITLSTALQQTTADRWILGQNKQSGDLAIWQPDYQPHIAVVGSSGAGKSETSLSHLIVGARYADWHPMILDAAGGADLRRFENVAEWYETDSGVFADQLRGVQRIVDERAEMIKAAGVPRVSELRHPPQPVLVLVEEFGMLMAQLSRTAATEVENTLGQLVRGARRYGVHLALADQDKSGWSDVVTRGITPTLTYRMADYGGASTKAYHADTLRVGQFQMDRATYTAWHVTPELGRILPALPVLAARLLEGRSVSERPNDTPDYTSSEHSGASPNGLTERPADKRELIFWWLDRTPTGTQAEFRRYLDQQGESIARGYISDCFAEWNAKRQGEIDAALATDSFSLEHLRTMLETGMDVRIIGKDIGSQR